MKLNPTLSFVLIVSFAPTLSFSLKQNVVLEVCQHKTCKKQHSSISNRPLPEIFRDLIPPQSDVVPAVSIECSGCLTQCGSGPNVAVKIQMKKLFGFIDEDETLFNKVDSPQMAASVLETGCGLVCPPMLVAACDVMSKAESATLPSDKEKLLSSVISALESNPEFSLSHALASALTLRADARLSMTPPNTAGAMDDSRKSTSISPLNEKGWKVLAKVEEKAGNIEEAMVAMRRCMDVNPGCATKARNEISRLSSCLSSR